MNIWNVNYNVDEYMWCIFRETDSMNFSQFSQLFINEDTLANTLPKDIVLKNKDKKDNSPIADMMACSGTMSGIVSEKVKELFEKEYSGLFCFFPACLDELPNVKYYILLPTVYLVAENVLDMEHTKIKYVGDNIERGIIFDIQEYSFTRNVKGHHFFRMAFNNGGKKLYTFRYCDDEFKDFIEKNNITGLEFTKIFELKD